MLGAFWAWFLVRRCLFLLRGCRVAWFGLAGGRCSRFCSSFGGVFLRRYVLVLVEGGLAWVVAICCGDVCVAAALSFFFRSMECP